MRPAAGRPSHRLLDLVVSHFAVPKLQDTIDVWTEVINLPNLRPLKPYIFLYCKNADISITDLEWFTQHGEVHHLDNTGRESHTYVWHILNNYDDLANHTVFHQDIPESMPTLTSRLGLLSPRTGLLGLGLMATCQCKTCFLHHLPKITEIWAMVQRSFCAPGDIHMVFLQGAFLVSSHRILAVPKKVFASLEEYSGAGEDHWVHDEHSMDWGRLPSNPVSAHVLERSWNILFDCLDPDINRHCEMCDHSISVLHNGTCPPSACQCLD